jgi:putative ABC transport system permease protein
VRRDVDSLVYVASTQEKEPPVGAHFQLRSRDSISLGGQRQTGGARGKRRYSLAVPAFPDHGYGYLAARPSDGDAVRFFGLLAGVLATLGLYGVISYMVARRRNEIGIRVALGADRTDIVRLVIREAAVLVGAGIVIGVLLTAGGARITKSLLYGLEGQDPVTIGMAVALLAAVSLTASLLPAIRASQLDPVQALREE